jgi:excisionase family DNA binding protein
MPDECLTVAEVASRLKLNQQTVRNMIDRGQLGAVRVGQRRVPVRQSQLDAFLTATETGHEPARSTATHPEETAWHRVREATDVLTAAVEAHD